MRGKRDGERMSYEDIFEVERLEKEQLATYEAQMQEPPCASCEACYQPRGIHPCNDCNVLDSSKSISRYEKHQVR